MVLESEKSVLTLFNGEKKVFWAMKKEVSPQLLYSENKSVSTVFPSWSFHPKTKEYLATVTRLNITVQVCTVFLRCFKGVV